MSIYSLVAQELGIREKQVADTMELIDNGDTITFIARYRREITGNLETEVLFAINDKVTGLRNLESRKETVIRQIEKFGKLTPEVAKRVAEFTSRARLDEYYEGFIPREDSQGTKAISMGLKPVADAIKELDDLKLEEAFKTLEQEKQIPRITALAGAKHILYEELQFDMDLRDIGLAESNKMAIIETKKINKRNKEEEVDTYDMYAEFTSEVNRLKSHNALAILRGVREKQISMDIVVDDQAIKEKLVKNRIPTSKIDTLTGVEYKKLIELTYDNIYKSNIASLIKKDIGDKAEDRATEVFAKNLYSLLMQKPVKGKVLGVDPGVRTGTKLALISETGAPMSTGIIKPLTNSQADREKADLAISQCIAAGAKVFAVGNGTASKENVNYLTDYFRRNNIKDVQYTVVSESGASIYSTSETAKKEFPNFDEYQISSISIARRLQDPLAELVKLDPKTLGVGQYQHDIKLKKLDMELERVVETCVNRVGVNLNTASPHLLSRVAGLNSKISTNIVNHRLKNGNFQRRQDLLDVPGITPEIFKQSAGFLRIYDGEDRLDSCFVHPENYRIASDVLKMQDENKSRAEIVSTLASKHNTSKGTILDIYESVNVPMYDIREEGDVIEPIMRNDVLGVDDISLGEMFTGTVRSVTDFGAFIDIGIHQDVLLHISQISKSRIKDIHEAVKVGQQLNVTILKISDNKKKIGVTLLEN